MEILYKVFPRCVLVLLGFMFLLVRSQTIDYIATLVDTPTRHILTTSVTSSEAFNGGSADSFDLDIQIVSPKYQDVRCTQNGDTLRQAFTQINLFVYDILRNAVSATVVCELDKTGEQVPMRNIRFGGYRNHGTSAPKLLTQGSGTFFTQPQQTKTNVFVELVSGTMWRFSVISLLDRYPFTFAFQVTSGYSRFYSDLPTCTGASVIDNRVYDYVTITGADIKAGFNYIDCNFSPKGVFGSHTAYLQYVTPHLFSSGDFYRQSYTAPAYDGYDIHTEQTDSTLTTVFIFNIKSRYSSEASVVHSMNLLSGKYHSLQRCEKADGTQTGMSGISFVKNTGILRFNLQSVTSTEQSIKCTMRKSGYAVLEYAPVLVADYSGGSRTSLPFLLAAQPSAFSVDMTVVGLKYTFTASAMRDYTGTITTNFKNLEYAAQPSCTDAQNAVYTSFTYVSQVLTFNMNTAQDFLVTCSFAPSRVPTKAVTLSTVFVIEDFTQTIKRDVASIPDVISVSSIVSGDSLMQMFIVDTKFAKTGTSLSMDVSAGEYIGSSCDDSSFTFVSGVQTRVGNLRVGISIYQCIMVAGGLEVPSFATSATLTYKNVDNVDAMVAGSAVSVPKQEVSVFFTVGVVNQSYTYVARSTKSTLSGSIVSSFTNIPYMTAPTCVDDNNAIVTTGFTYESKVLNIALTSIDPTKRLNVTCTFTPTAPYKSSDVVTQFVLGSREETVNSAVAANPDAISVSSVVSSDGLVYTLVIDTKFAKTGTSLSMDVSAGEYIGGSCDDSSFTFASGMQTRVGSIDAGTSTYHCTMVVSGLEVPSFATSATFTYKNVDNADATVTGSSLSVPKQEVSVFFTVGVVNQSYTYVARSTKSTLSGSIVSSFTNIPYVTAPTCVDDKDAIVTTGFTYESKVLNIALTSINPTKHLNVTCTFTPTVPYKSSDVVTQFVLGSREETVNSAVAANPDAISVSSVVSSDGLVYTLVIDTKFAKTGTSLSMDVSAGEYIGGSCDDSSFTFVSGVQTRVGSLNAGNSAYQCAMVSSEKDVSLFTTAPSLVYKDVDNADATVTGSTLSVPKQDKYVLLVFSVVNDLVYSFEVTSKYSNNGNITMDFATLPYTTPTCLIGTTPASITYTNNILTYSMQNISTDTSFTMLCTFATPVRATASSTIVSASLVLGIHSISKTHSVTASPEQVTVDITSPTHHIDSMLFRFEYSIVTKYAHDMTMHSTLPALVFVDIVECTGGTFDATENTLDIVLGSVATTYTGSCSLRVARQAHISELMSFTLSSASYNTTLGTSSVKLRYESAVTTPGNSSRKSDTLSDGAIAGIVIGGIAFVSVVLFGIFWFTRKVQSVTNSQKEIAGTPDTEMTNIQRVDVV